LKSGLRFEVGLPGAEVLFSTRVGGVSEPPYDSFNLGLLTGDDSGHVIENRRILAEDAGLEPEAVAMGWQVHGTDIRTWDGPTGDGSFLDPRGGREKFDGHVTSAPELGLLVLVADCLPVALVGDGGIAMVHCGWRGLAGGIIARAAELVGTPKGAAVGPGIGPCCYEVGDEVLAAFEDHPDAANGRMLNLRAVADAQLKAAGAGRVEHVDLCTSCNPDLFFSHRRDDGVTGRQGGLAWLTG
jgi:hypothetical protein